MANPRALIVDDEPDLCELLSLTLARMGVESTAVHGLASARRELQGSRDYALCLTDLPPDRAGTQGREPMGMMPGVVLHRVAAP